MWRVSMKKQSIRLFILVVALFSNCFIVNISKASTLSEEEYNHLSKVLRTGQTEELKKMITAGFDVNDYYQCHRPLNLAIKAMAFAYGSVVTPNITPQKAMDMIELLLTAGADVNAYTLPNCKIERSPIEQAIALPTTLRGLHYIFTKSIKDVFNEEIAKCNKENAKDEECKEISKEKMDIILTEVDKFYEAKHKELETVTLQILTKLLAAGADINLTDSSGRNALHWAIIYHRESDSLNIIKFLIKNGVNINAQDINGYTPIFFTYDHPEVRRYLIQVGANTSLKDNNGNIYSEMTGRSLHEYIDEDGYHIETAKY